MSDVRATPPVLASDQRARFATAITFFIAGATWGNWVPRIPEVKVALDLSNSSLGLALLGTAFGSVAAMQVTGYIMSRHGTRGLVRAVTPALVISLLSIPLLDFNLGGLFASMLILGVFHGALDVAMNGHCIAVERRYRRPIVNSMHALFSVGGAFGALTGGLAASQGVSLAWQFGAVAIIGSAVSLASSYLLLSKATELNSVPSRSATGHQAHAPLRKVLNRPTMLLSVLALCAFVAEGGIIDWVTVYMREHLLSTPGEAALAFGVFQGTMAVVRLIADRGVHRWGPARVLRLNTLVGAGGLALGLLSGNIYIAVLGFAFAGIGVAVVVPLLFSAAGHAPSVDSARTLSTVTTAGYLGFFVGPPLLGFVADKASLTAAMFIPVVLIAIISAQANLVRDAGGSNALEAESLDSERRAAEAGTLI